MYVRFKGDKRQLARLAILASVPGLEEVSVEEIYTPNWVEYWNFECKTYPVKFFCPKDDLIHPTFANIDRPWAKKYPTALALVEAAELEVLEVLSNQEWADKITAKGLEV